MSGWSTPSHSQKPSVPAIQPSESAGSLGSNFVRPRHGRVVAPRPLENSSLPKKKPNDRTTQFSWADVFVK